MHSLDVKSRKQPHQAGAALNKRAIALDRLATGVEADDPNDAFLLCMALSGEANHLVTGDRRTGLLEKQRWSHTNCHAWNIGAEALCFL
jgi:uncharacterized protein